MCTTFCLPMQLLTLHFQSGLQTKKDKPTRKLRKERKNRAKKVRFPLVDSQLHTQGFTHSCAVPARSRQPSHRRRANSGWALFVHVCTLLRMLLSMESMCMRKNTLRPSSIGDHRIRVKYSAGISYEHRRKISMKTDI